MNAPLSFQRFMQKCLQDYWYDFVVPYVDHFQAFEWLRQYDVKVEASRWQFFKYEVSYLGTAISVERYTNNPKAKKSSLVSGNRPGEKNFITHPPTQSNEYQNIYFYLKQKTKKTEYDEWYCLWICSVYF